MFKNFNNKQACAVHVAMSKIPTSNSNDTRMVYSTKIKKKKKTITIEIRLDDQSGSKECSTLITLAKKKYLFLFFYFIRKYSSCRFFIAIYEIQYPANIHRFLDGKYWPFS